ncbi:nucleic-acid-binding protein from transposon X-element [Trichonephila inaurata madagascariensis]|uniref:Nucleic-acid-binding protein from transposon X-element n=1 Tax=Trichonephila inaurata madagascariensis TaxID=2747483 RepID=A0A8X7CFW8_9ARAC|nr:nucleic-acid-binding protein from transposon X-element [Trichonephila inaurata madagascariensis]
MLQKVQPTVTSNKYFALAGASTNTDLDQTFFTNELTGEYIKTNPTSEEEHRKITSYFKLKNEQFFVFDPPASRPQKIVLKGLPTSSDIQDIKSDLENQGYIVEKVARLTKSKTKFPLPIFMVELKKFPNSPDANKISKCCYMTVTVDTFRKSPGPTQCYNCNYFHHSSKNCFLQMRCLKCGQSHKTSDCNIKEKIENLTCINCNIKGHMANWHECPTFPKTKTKKGEAAQNRNYKNNQNSFNSNANLIKKDFSYANTTQNAEQRAALDRSKSVHSEPEPPKTQTEKQDPRESNKNNENNFTFMDAMREFKIFFQEFPYLIEMGKALRNAEKHTKR